MAFCRAEGLLLRGAVRQETGVGGVLQPLDSTDVAQMAVREGGLHAGRAACSSLCGRGGLWQHEHVTIVELWLSCCQAGRCSGSGHWKILAAADEKHVCPSTALQSD